MTILCTAVEGAAVSTTDNVGVPVAAIGVSVSLVTTAADTGAAVGWAVSPRIVVGIVGPGVSTPGTIGADGADVAATGASVVGSLSTIDNEGADVTGASVMATPSGVITGDNDGSTEFEGICDAQKRWSLWFP